MVNSVSIRGDKEFKDLINKMRIERVRLGIDKDINSISERRITKAIARKITKEPSLFETFVISQLENDKRLSGRKLKSGGFKK
jgi:hypothetical protein